MPESISYLAQKKRPDALAQINGILTRMGHAVLEQLPASEENKHRMAGPFFTATRENNNPADHRLLGAHHHLLFHPQVDSQHRGRHGILGSIRWRHSRSGPM